jgi:alpha-D-ribose 1-methylphosphonate 5-triphosphate diphosphatase PhnM
MIICVFTLVAVWQYVCDTCVNCFVHKTCIWDHQPPTHQYNNIFVLLKYETKSHVHNAACKHDVCMTQRELDQVGYTYVNQRLHLQEISF